MRVDDNISIHFILVLSLVCNRDRIEGDPIYELPVKNGIVIIDLAPVL